MKIKRIKLFSEEEEHLEQLYKKYEKLDQGNAKKNILKSAGLGSIPGGAIGGLIGKRKSKTALGIVGGAVSGAGIGTGVEKLRLKKSYNDTKTELRNILAGFKTKEEKARFLGTLENELKGLGGD